MVREPQGGALPGSSASEQRQAKYEVFCGVELRNGNDEFALEERAEPFNASAARQSHHPPLF